MADTAPAGASEPHIVSEDSGPLDDHEVTLWTCKEMYVYQIPPLKSESGHRANDWNVDKWLWSGRLRVVSCGALLKVILEDATSGELFATCPCKDPHSKAVDPVVDSSRYFVLRIESGDGKHAPTTSARHFSSLLCLLARFPILYISGHLSVCCALLVQGGEPRG